MAVFGVANATVVRHPLWLFSRSGCLVVVEKTRLPRRSRTGEPFGNCRRGQTTLKLRCGL